MSGRGYRLSVLSVCFNTIEREVRRLAGEGYLAFSSFCLFRVDGMILSRRTTVSLTAFSSFCLFLEDVIKDTKNIIFKIVHLSVLSVCFSSTTSMGNPIILILDPRLSVLSVCFNIITQHG